MTGRRSTWLSKAKTLAAVVGVAALFFAAHSAMKSLDRSPAVTVAEIPQGPAPGKAVPGNQAAGKLALPVAKSTGCNAANCHGHAIPPEGARQAEDTWRWAGTIFVRESKPDPHERAFRILEEPASKKIMERLRRKGSAGDDLRCIGCHSNPADAAMMVAQDDGRRRQAAAHRSTGLTCDACHRDDADRTWLHEHPGWTADVDFKKRYEELGIPWLNDLDERATMCVGCHVGAKDDPKTKVRREVDHELIAAGHPPLNFELSTYIRLLPKHWYERDRNAGGPSVSSRAAAAARTEAVWSAGQRAVLEASLDLLESRMDAKRDVADLAQTRCFDCHDHLIVGGRKAVSRDVDRGSTVWRRSAELRSLSDWKKGDDPEEFLREWDRLYPNAVRMKSLIPGVRKAVAENRASLQSLDDVFRHLEKKTWNPHELTWDEAQWLRAALTMVESTRRELGGAKDDDVECALTDLARQLRIYDPPDDPDHPPEGHPSADPAFVGIMNSKPYDPVMTGEILMNLLKRLREIDPRL